MNSFIAIGIVIGLTLGNSSHPKIDFSETNLMKIAAAIACALHLPHRRLWYGCMDFFNDIVNTQISWLLRDVYELVDRLLALPLNIFTWLGHRSWSSSPEQGGLMLDLAPIPLSIHQRHVQRPEFERRVDFLRLPLDIRHLIYDTHLAPDQKEILSIGRVGIRPFRPIVGVNLLRTCRQVYEEAIRTVYRRRTFHLPPAGGLANLIGTMTHGCESIYTLNSSARKRVEAISIPILVPYLDGTVHDFVCFKRLAEVPSLERVSFAICLEHGEDNWDGICEYLWLSPYLTGLVVQLLGAVPKNCTVVWPRGEPVDWSPTWRASVEWVHVVPRPILAAVHSRYALQGVDHDRDSNGPNEVASIGHGRCTLCEM